MPDLTQEKLYRLDPDVPRLVVVGEVWPEQHRTWVPEVRQRQELLWREDGWTSKRPFSPELSAELENEMNVHLQAAGLSPRRAGGAWHVALPGRWTTLQKYLATVFRRAERAGLPGHSDDSQWATFVRETIAADFAAGQR